MSYHFVEDVSLADVAFEASGKDLKELFESAGLAVTNTMVRNLASVHTKVTKTVDVEGSDVENLMFNFLQEFVFLKDAERLLFGKIKIDEISEIACKATLYGEKLDSKRHDLSVDVKAITYHMFRVERTREGWQAFVVLDV
ncbi:MAG: archease [Candidatus Aenigmatarchaeota archaeon]|nr:MAG: archease [Candidatus Aenigmarchaeota archaeon]